MRFRATRFDTPASVIALAATISAIPPSAIGRRCRSAGPAASLVRLYRDGSSPCHRAPPHARASRGSGRVAEVEGQRGRGRAAGDPDAVVVAALARRAVAVAGAVLQAGGGACPRPGDASGASPARHRVRRAQAADHAAIRARPAADDGGGSRAAEVALLRGAAALRRGVAAHRAGIGGRGVGGPVAARPGVHRHGACPPARRRGQRHDGCKYQRPGSVAPHDTTISPDGTIAAHALAGRSSGGGGAGIAGRRLHRHRRRRGRVWEGRRKEPRRRRWLADDVRHRDVGRSRDGRARVRRGGGPARGRFDEPAADEPVHPGSGPERPPDDCRRKRARSGRRGHDRRRANVPVDGWVRGGHGQHGRL